MREESLRIKFIGFHKVAVKKRKRKKKMLVSVISGWAETRCVFPFRRNLNRIRGGL